MGHQENKTSLPSQHIKEPYMHLLYDYNIALI